MQVGEHTQVFKYGDQDDQKPRLIDEYISYFKDSKGPGKKQEMVKKSLVRHRSNSEDAFFKVKKEQREKTATHRGLVGAEGTAPQN